MDTRSKLEVRLAPLPRKRTHHVCVFIGRFRPLHRAHLKIIKEALARGEIVVVIVGSAFAARSERNPFTFDEVREMILACLTEDERQRVFIEGVPDVLYELEAWETAVRAKVREAVRSHLEQSGVFDGARPSIALIGHSKDQSSFYLQRFQEWDAIDVPMTEDMSATAIRDALFDGRHWRAAAEAVVPAPAMEFLERFEATPAYEWLRQECAANRHHRTPFEAFRRSLRESHGYDSEIPQMAADIALIQSGHILMVQRNEFPGKGLWALPGTFLAPQESLLDCAFRGLMTKTSVHIPEEILRANIVAQGHYHHPHRSCRGRILTEAFLIHLTTPHRGPTPHPKVKGPADRRYRPWWISLADLKPEECYEDHYLIIQDLLRRNKRNLVA